MRSESNKTLEKTHQIQKNMTYRNQMANGRSPFLSVITSNVNGLNYPIKRQRLENRLKKET